MISHFGNTKMSDTCEFTTTVLASLPTLEAQLAVLKLANTKFIFIRDSQVYKIGTFYKYKGLSVSNDHFIPRSTPPKGTLSTKWSNACANTLGFGNRHVSASNEDTTEVLRNLDGISDTAMSEQEIAEALDARDYFEHDGILIKKPQPIFDSASGCYYEYDYDFDDYVKKCRD
jgi:hypothetical protein